MTLLWLTCHYSRSHKLSRDCFAWLAMTRKKTLSLRGAKATWQSELVEINESNHYGIRVYFREPVYGAPHATQQFQFTSVEQKGSVRCATRFEDCFHAPVAVIPSVDGIQTESALIGRKGHCRVRGFLAELLFLVENLIKRYEKGNAAGISCSTQVIAEPRHASAQALGRNRCCASRLNGRNPIREASLESWR